MPELSSQPFTLTGGCFCQAIRYTISVPKLSERPMMPELSTEIDHAIGKHDQTKAHYPQVEVDHCSMCRRVQGSIVVVWLVVIRSWLKFSFLPKTSLTISSSTEESRIEPDITEVLRGARNVVENTFLAHYSSSEEVDRLFCSRCGTHLTFTHNPPAPEKQGMDISFGTLDPEFLEWKSLKPRVNGFEGSGIGWVRKWLKEGETALSRE